MADHDTHDHTGVPGVGGGSGTVTTVKDEGVNLSTAVVSIDFVGAGVTATGTTAVTVTIAGGSTTSFVKAYSAVTLVLGAATFTAVAMASEEEDTDGYHSTVTNNTRLTVPTGKGGVFIAHGYFSGGGTTTAIAQLYKNGSTPLRSQAIIAGTNSGIHVDSGPVRLADADYIELRAYLAAGGTIGDATNIEQQNWVSLVRIGS